MASKVTVTKQNGSVNQENNQPMDLQLLEFTKFLFVGKQKRKSRPTDVPSENQVPQIA